MPKTYFKRVTLNRLLNSNVILTVISILLFLELNRNSIQFVCCSALSTPYPDANARPTITSKLENLSDLHRTTPSNSSTPTEGYLNINANDSFGKCTTVFLFYICSY